MAFLFFNEWIDMTIKGKTFTARCKQAEHNKYAAQVLDAWDRQNPNEKARRVGGKSMLDTDAEIRRKANAAL